MTTAWSVDISTFLSHRIRTRLCEQKGVTQSRNPRERRRGQGAGVSRETPSGERVLSGCEQNSAHVQSRSSGIDRLGHDPKASPSCVALGNF